MLVLFRCKFCFTDSMETGGDNMVDKTVILDVISEITSGDDVRLVTDVLFEMLMKSGMVKTSLKVTSRQGLGRK